MFLQHFPQDTAKLIFFENLFYMLDSDSNGLILIEETFFGNTGPGWCLTGRSVRMDVAMDIQPDLHPRVNRLSSISQQRLHPGRLTWNLRIHPWKRKNIFQTIIFRFYDSLRGCSFQTEKPVSYLRISLKASRLISFKGTNWSIDVPWELKTFIFRGSNPYIGGLKPFIFHGFGVQG